MTRSARPPIRLAYITTVASTQWAFLRGQNAFLAARGIELHAIASPGPFLDRLAGRDGVTPHPLAIPRTITPARDLLVLCRLIRLLRRISPDIVHVSTPKAALLGAVAAWIVRVPVRLFLMRGSASEGAEGLRRTLLCTLERLTARLCHQTICVSPSLLEFCRRAGILDPGEGIVAANGMSNGIDAHRFDPSQVAPDPDSALPPAHRELADSRNVVIGFVGRLARDKGIEEIAAAWSAIRDQHPRTRLLLVGKWETESQVSPSCREMLERDPRVHLPGRVEDVAPWYRLMSIFVFPSHGTEGFPNAPMEAASMRLPVIASRVVGNIDAVHHGVTGQLIPPRDAVALAGALRRYLDSPSLRTTHGSAGRQRVLERFQQEVVWQALFAEYLRLLRARGVAAESGPTERFFQPSAPRVATSDTGLL